MSVTLMAYQGAYLYLKNSRYYYKFLRHLVLNTFLYFTYLKVYLPPSHHSQLYRASLHTLYCTSLVYHLLHNLNRLAFQFEALLHMLDTEGPGAGFERIISQNLSRALARRMVR